MAPPHPYVHRAPIYPGWTNMSSAPPTTFTATQLASIYQFPPVNPSATYNIAVCSFGGGLTGTVASNGVVTNGDVQLYWKSIGIPTASYPTVILHLVNGARNAASATDNGTLENILDISVIGGLLPTAKTTIHLFLATAASDWTNILNAIKAMPSATRPVLVNNCWGLAEDQTGNTTAAAKSYVQYMDNLIATSGMIWCSASGDNGSSDNGSTISVDFPASSPHVIAVGGTTLTCPSGVYANATTRESVWNNLSSNNGGSGGGFSKYFPRPSYQASVNSTNARSVPDVCMAGNPSTGVVVFQKGVATTVGGTSLACPIFMGYLALLRATVTVTTVAYAPSFLYAISNPYANGFRDITTGTNGYYAASTGFDQASGLGSINGQAMVRAWNTNLFRSNPSPSPPASPSTYRMSTASKVLTILLILLLVALIIAWIVVHRS